MTCNRNATGDRRLVMLLAITQTAGYGVLYYSFSVFLTPMAATLRASTTTVTGALALSLLAAAAMAVPVGRWLDRHGGRALMTSGSVAASALVVIWSQVQTLAELYVVWIGIGLASAGVLYEAAFAVLVARCDPARRSSALLAVTVVAGFASSIFLPVAGWLDEAVGWRTAVLLLGVGYAALTVPLHALIRTRRTVRSSAAAPADRSALIRQALREQAYWLLGGAFVVQAVAIAAISVLLVSMLRGLGQSPGFSASVAGLLGVLSVTGRLATVAAAGRWSTARITALVFGVQAIGALLLAPLGRSAIGAIGCVLAFGLGFGVSTIARPSILAERYSTAVYATLAATWSVPLTLVKALAPLAAAALWHSAGLQVTMDTIAACCLLGAIALAAGERTGRQGQLTQRRAAAAGFRPGDPADAGAPPGGRAPAARAGRPSPARPAGPPG